MDILFPVGRLVGGSLYTPQPQTDHLGKPKLDAAGQPIKRFNFGVAFEKNGTTHFAQTAWGKIIWDEAHKAWPGGQTQRPDFAWKVTDGDSTTPNKKGNKPCDQTGYPGNWVIWFSGTYAPKLCDATGTPEGVRRYSDPANGEIIKAGHFVQVFGSTVSNQSAQTAGMYMNFSLVAHSGFGAEIELRNAPDAAAVGFGASPLPAGASTMPVGGVQVSQPAGTPPPPGAAPAAPAVPGPAAVLPPPIVPSTAFLEPPPVAHVMTAAAKGGYDDYRKAGWSDDQLRAGGLML